MVRKIPISILCKLSNIDLECLRRRIISYEGFRERPYWDKLHFTVGYGTTLSAKHWIKYIAHPKKFKISEKEAAEELDKYIYDAVIFLENKLGHNIMQLNSVRREAFVDMIFNMGPSRFSKFIKLNNELKKPIIHWPTAALEVEEICMFNHLL